MYAKQSDIPATPTVRARIEAGIRTADAEAILRILEHTSWHDPGFVRAVGGVELEQLIEHLAWLRCRALDDASPPSTCCMAERGP
jgi:hypothetical protein